MLNQRLGYNPEKGSYQEEEGLEVVRREVDKLELLPSGQVGRPQDVEEVLLNGECVPLGPAHPLAGQGPYRFGDLGRCLDQRCVEHLVAVHVHPEGQVPVLGDAVGPPKLPQDVRPDHEDASGDHLQRAEELLGHPLDHVPAAELRPHALRDPVLVLVQVVELVALDDADPSALEPALDPFEDVSAVVVVPVLVVIQDIVGEPVPVLPFMAAVTVLALEIPKEPPQDVGLRHEVGVEDDDVLGPGVHELNGALEGAALEPGPVLPVDNLDRRAIPPLVQLLEYVYGLVPRVVRYDDLVVSVVHVDAGLNYPPSYVLLVVEGELYGYEGLLLLPV